MRATRIAVTALACWSVVLSTQPRLALAGGRGEHDAEIQGHAQAAARSVRLGLYEQAQPDLQEVFRLTGNPVDALALADCARRVGDLDTAYEALLKVRDATSASRRQAKAIHAALDEIASQTGLVEVAAPAGAQVTIDGRAARSSAHGWALRVAAGPIVVRVTAPSMTPWERVVDVTAQGTFPLEASLSASRDDGYLYVTEASSQAVHVLVDGRDVGPAPWHGYVSPGAHQLTLQGTNLTSTPTPVSVEAGVQQTLALTAAPTVGHLHATVTPSAADLLVDGQKAGTGQLDTDLPVGKHELRAELAEYVAEKRDVETRSGETTSLELHLNPVPPPPYKGFYGAFMIGYADPISSPDIPPSGSAYGSAMALHLGYNTGYVGVEGVLAPLGHYFAADNSPSIYEVGGFLGAGVRVLSHGEVARFTLGVQGGAEGRAYIMKGFSSAPQISPALMADAGIMLGSTPGAKFFIGPTLYAWFPLSSVTPTGTNGGPSVLASGTSIAVGGMIGVFFGS